MIPARHLYLSFQAFVALSTILWPRVAAAQGVALPSSRLDETWLIAAAGFTLLIQLGFLLRETGLVPSANPVFSVKKSLFGFCLGMLPLAALGLVVAFARFGTAFHGWPADTFLLDRRGTWPLAAIVFQAMYCATATTIVAAAVADRMRLSVFVIGSLAVAGLISPAFAHWAWATPLFPGSLAFLERIGFLDFGGATVIHATGGWIALAASVVIARRIGSAKSGGPAIGIGGRSPALFVTGSLLLFIGWTGFGSGAGLPASGVVVPMILKAVMAGGTGACLGCVIAFLIDRREVLRQSLAGVLGGMVAATAGGDALDLAGALMIGAVGGAVACLANAVVERRLKIDDAVGAVGIHAGAGVAGTLCLPLLMPVELLPAGNRLMQIYIQAVGVGVNFYWSFGCGYLLFSLLNWLTVRRGRAQDEDAVREHPDRTPWFGSGQYLQTSATGAAHARRMDDATARLTYLLTRLVEEVEQERRGASELGDFHRDREAAERVTALASATFEAIVMHRDGRVIDANEQLIDLVGIPRAELIGRSIHDFLEDGRDIRIVDMMVLNDGQAYEIFVRRPDGETIPVQGRGRDIVYGGKRARVGCLVDLRERKQAEDHIRYLAQHDGLTGLPNRALFSETLQAFMSGPKGRQGCAILTVDLDRIKHINGVHGHQAGDAVIREAARRLALFVTMPGWLGRLGGDAFAVLVESTGAAELEELARSILEAIAVPVDIGFGNSVGVSASIGGAVSPDHAHDPDALVACADIALYHAKNNGRNSFRMFQPGMTDLIDKRRTLEADLDTALEQREFELYLQPRIRVETGQINGYEGLLRWHHPSRGMISPLDFIPVAEASGKIVKLGAWVLEEACRLLQLVDGQISVNVSPTQFRQSDFVADLADLMRRTGADPRRLELEITESVLIDDHQRAFEILTALKALGVHIALDDFGTGYSSLSYLSRYPFDTIKIDRSFVSDIGRMRNAQVIIRSIVQLGAGLGMKIVAEGVERLEEALFLAQAGCDELQGYLLGRPQPLDRLVRSIDARIAASLRAVPRRRPDARDEVIEAGLSLPVDGHDEERPQH